MAAECAGKALAVVIPNVTSMVGCCCASGGCSFSSCCKATEESTPAPCPLPKRVWHAAVVGANSTTGYASYLVWKELRGLGHHEHSAYAVYLLSNAIHPCLLKKCDTWGCGPAVVNAVLNIGICCMVTQLFMKVDRRAGHFMIPGIIMSLLRAGCTISCACKKCGKCETGCKK